MIPRTRQEIIETALFLGLFAALGIAWYFAWVKPNDEAMHRIMECMGNDSTREAYDACVTRLLKQEPL